MKDRIYAWVPRERMTLRLLATCVQGELRSCRVRESDGAMLLKWRAEHRDLVVRSGLVPMSLDEVSRDMTAEQARLGEGREAWQGRVEVAELAVAPMDAEADGRVALPGDDAVLLEAERKISRVLVEVEAEVVEGGKADDGESELVEVRR
jgi:hypothetical protein